MFLIVIFRRAVGCQVPTSLGRPVPVGEYILMLERRPYAIDTLARQEGWGGLVQGELSPTRVQWSSVPSALRELNHSHRCSRDEATRERWAFETMYLV